ncbi:MAG: hypothetical protein LBN99_07265 [Oscillospiraceae bacterium]|jgi:hypothetical protein|nr:hypothetical protein [Oscillospiraceae bacterium]
MSDATLNENADGDSCFSITCPATIEKSAIISVPARIKPFALVGPIEACCDGNPVVTPGWHPIGHERCSCEFTISQEISVRIPISFGADVTVGDVFADCDSHPGYPHPKPPYDPGQKPGKYPPNAPDNDNDCGCGGGKGGQY